jgi:hypothetical protein
MFGEIVRPIKAPRTPSDESRPGIPSQYEGSKKDFLPEFTLSLAEGVEMTISGSFVAFASLRHGSGHALASSLVFLRELRVLRGELLDDGDFLDRKLRGDLGTFFGDHHHLFKAHAPLKRLAVLCL